MTIDNGFSSFRSIPLAALKAHGLDSPECVGMMNQVLNSSFRYYLESYDYELCLNYRGPFQDEITTKIVDLSENSIIESGSLGKVHRRVSFLLVECFQNIVKHADDYQCQPDRFASSGMFSFRNLNQAYLINTINGVKDDDVPFLKKAVELVNNMDRETLKEFYKRQLERTELDHKGGAGLGLIELARRSGQKLQVQFDERPEGTYFHQQVLFLEDDRPEIELNDHMLITRHDYKAMEDNDLLMQYKGDFFQKGILPLLHIVEHNLMDRNADASARKIAHVLVEALQNISKHGCAVNGRKDGIFMLGKRCGHTYIVAGNLLHNRDRESLFGALNELDGLQTEELKVVHKERIKASMFSEDRSNAGLGLIEIARACGGKLAYDFRPFDKDRSFFSLFACV